MDVERLNQLRDELRALGLPSSVIEHELALVVKDAEANTDSRDAALVNRIELQRRSGNE